MESAIPAAAHDTHEPHPRQASISEERSGSTHRPTYPSYGFRTPLHSDLCAGRDISLLGVTPSLPLSAARGGLNDNETHIVDRYIKVHSIRGGCMERIQKFRNLRAIFASPL